MRIRLSINLESPDDLTNAADTYHPTAQGIEFVEHLASSALMGGGAYSLEGPYGIGKSSLAAFALNQLSCQTKTFNPKPAPRLFESKENPVGKVLSQGGMMTMPITASFASLSLRIASAMKKLADNAIGGRRTRALRMCAAVNPEQASHQQVVALLAECAVEARKQGRAGVLLVIDEFGRHLDHIASTENDSEFHLLQTIAEMTGHPDSPLSLVIIQHYGLEHYAAKFSAGRQAEWEKVRGRFRETILDNTETDSAKIIGRMIRSQACQNRGDLSLPKSQDDEPMLLRDPAFLSAADECQPLHPMTVALLSRLARQLGQQDRTIVGWLTSDYATGFRNALRNSGGGWIYPEALFGHFFCDDLAIPTNPLLAKRVAAIHNASDRLGDNTGTEARELFETLAILSFCAGRGFFANKATALVCLPPGFDFDAHLRTLMNKSLLVHRRHRGGYDVWEGSDYDVSQRINEVSNIFPYSLSTELNLLVGRSVLAHGHLIKTGNRRMSDLAWLQAGDKPRAGNGHPRILIWLDVVPSGHGTEVDVIGATSANALTPHLKEAAAIRRLLADDTELQDDPVAKREIKLRLDYHKERITALSEGLLNDNLQWHVGDEQFETMQQALTAAMNKAYPKAFILHNDLVNRDRVSAPVSAALRILLQAAHDHPEDENFRITKFPAERIIYESFIKQQGLHALGSDGAWRLNLDGDRLSPELAGAIGRIREYFVGAGGNGAPLAELLVELGNPPYGIKHSPTILLCIFLLLAHRDDHELYEDGKYLPHWGAQTLIRLFKGSGRFSISAAAKVPISKSYLRRYGCTLSGMGPPHNADAPVKIVRDLLVRYSRLSLYARETKKVSGRSQAFRRAIEIAKSPGDMLFRTIPDALGYEEFPTQGVKKEEFLRRIKGVLAELEAADWALMKVFEKVLADALDCRTLGEGRVKCMDFAMRVLSGSDMHHDYEEFIASVIEGQDADDHKWLGRVIDNGLGIRAPISSWSDAQAAQAEFLLRKALIGLQQAAGLLAKAVQCNGSAPLVVFWRGGRKDRPLLPAERELASIVGAMDRSDRMPAIVNLAAQFKEEV